MQTKIHNAGIKKDAQPSRAPLGIIFFLVLHWIHLELVALGELASQACRLAPPYFLLILLKSSEQARHVRFVPDFALCKVLHCFERLIQVLDDVGDVLDTDRETDGVSLDVLIQQLGLIAL